MKSKEGSAGPSAFEMEAAELALAKVAEADFDPEQAVTLLNAVLTLGLQDSEKVASFDKYEDALERRALEYAEAAGYPVLWS
jgi:serine phosphatase RsbU (regulator of sigma subunit)